MLEEQLLDKGKHVNRFVSVVECFDWVHLPPARRVPASILTIVLGNRIILGNVHQTQEYGLWLE